MAGEIGSGEQWVPTLSAAGLDQVVASTQQRLTEMHDRVNKTGYANIGAAFDLSFEADAVMREAEAVADALDAIVPRADGSWMDVFHPRDENPMIDSAVADLSALSEAELLTRRGVGGTALTSAVTGGIGRSRDRQLAIEQNAPQI